MTTKSQVEVDVRPVTSPASPALSAEERTLLLVLRQQGYELVADWCIGPHGPYQHRRVIRRRRAA